jgi:hypothetical protein
VVGPAVGAIGVIFIAGTSEQAVFDEIGVVTNQRICGRSDLLYQHICEVLASAAASIVIWIGGFCRYGADFNGGGRILVAR